MVPRNPTGPCVVAGAGTGLGEAFLVWSPGENRYQVIPSEGGHVDFTPRTALESGLFHYLSGRYGRVSFERVLSGPGIADTFAFLSAEPGCRPLVRQETLAAIVTEDPADGRHPAGAGRRRSGVRDRAEHLHRRCWEGWPATSP